MKKFNVIDLFCGCGGFSKGFEEAGFNICFGIDMWKDATVTYQHNFSNAVVLNEDITKISGEDILKMCSLQATEVDVIIGGPPCQGFSVSGKRMIDDERNRISNICKILFNLFCNFSFENPDKSRHIFHYKSLRFNN